MTHCTISNPIQNYLFTWNEIWCTIPTNPWLPNACAFPTLPEYYSCAI